MSPAALRVLGLAKMHWPQAHFWGKEREVVASVVECRETHVVAGNKLGKDWTAGRVCVLFFVYPQFFFPPSYVRGIEAQRRPGQPDWLVHTRRIVTTSVRDKHLDVLWGEIGSALLQSAVPLLASQGGPLVLSSKEVRFRDERVSAGTNPLNYLIGTVSQKGEGMAGHHAAYTLAVGDECSGIEDVVQEMAQGWAKKSLWFGNPNATENFWRKAVDEGDLA